MRDELPSKRPWRKVIGSESIDDYPAGAGVDLKTRKIVVRTSKVWKVFLECGHYVVLSKKRWYEAPSRLRCVICGTKKENLNAKE